MSSLRSTLRRAIGGLLATSVALSFPAAIPAGTVSAAVAAPSKLDVQSEPAGAAIYVNGKFAGHTPLVLDLPAGEHRVKLAKIGYLEKSRVVKLRPGETMAVSLTLTASAVTAAEAGEGRSKRKLALLGLGALALGGGGYALASRNHAPVAGTPTANPYTALAAVMNVTFRADAVSDRDHDPLTYEWSFGDGSRAEGRQVNHVYAEPGSFSATLTVSDGQATASAPPVSITVRGMSGVWVSSHEGIVRTWTLQQAGATVTGSYSHSGLSPAQGTGSVNGALAPPNALRVTAAIPGSQPFAFEGFLDASLDRLEGRADGSGFSNTPLIFLRQ